MAQLIQSRDVDRKTLVSTIQAVTARMNGRYLSQRRFLLESKIGIGTIQRHFPTWPEALVAAGCNVRPTNAQIDLAVVYADWAETVRKLGRVPTQTEHNLHGKIRAVTVARRFGNWHLLPDSFRKFADGKPEWADVLPLLPLPGHRAPTSRPGYRSSSGRMPDRGGERVYGDPLDFKNLRHAPVNEMGVVYLFAMMAEDLGFLIESIQPGFPDCEAMRRSLRDSGKWRIKRIEFEYESKNFREHEHPADGCDIIVCWKHNWPECPANIEVIALQEEVRRLAA